MEEGIQGFIKTWNNNIGKVNGYNQSYHSLAKFCISTCKKVFKKFSIEKLIIELYYKKGHYKKEIQSIKVLEEALHFEYHIKKIKNESLDRKITYTGQKNKGYEVTFDRNLSIDNNKIHIRKVTQKEIDLSIVKKYVSEDGGSDYDDWFSFSSNKKEEFIFYQISLYNNNIYRISKWFNLLKNMTNTQENININDLAFLSNLYNFFKNYNKLETEQERLDLWFSKLKENKNYKYFIEYFVKKNGNLFNENLIKLFKDDHFKKLNNDFDINLKKSINKNDFLKIQIKEYKLLLNKPSVGNRGYREINDHNAVYDDLIKGKRDNYYHNTRLAKLAGETEAIFDFTKYLEGLTLVSKKRKIANKNVALQLDLLPIEIFDSTRDYLRKNAIQVNTCYKYKAYDACFVLLRKITETLIIELYEKEEIEDKIKDNDGNYFMLKKLIILFQNEGKLKKINSRSITEILPRIKKNGDLSAHKRKYNARKSDVDRIRGDYRIVFEEFIHSIYH